MSMHLGEMSIGSGASGAEVKAIQNILQGQGYNFGPIYGLYGPQTQAAVSAFQKSKSLVPDGIVGPLTWDALQGKPPAPAVLPTVPPAAPSAPGMGMLGMTAVYGIGALLLLALIGTKR